MSWNEDGSDAAGLQGMSSRYRSLLLEVRHLRAVRAIAAEGSVTRAAARLYLTQSAVSRTLLDLEKRLRVKLFHRTRQGMVPTSACSRMLRVADEVLAQLAMLEDELVPDPLGHRAILRLTVECFTTYDWLPGVMEAFWSENPHCKIEIRPGLAEGPTQALLDDQADLALVHSPIVDRELGADLLFENELIAVVSPSHALSGKGVLVPEDLADENLVLHANPRDALIFTELLEPHGIEPRQITELKLTEVVLEAVKAGLGIGIVPSWIASPVLETGLLVALRLTEDGIRLRWQIAYLRRRAHDPPLAALRRVLMRQLRSGIRGHETECEEASR